MLRRLLPLLALALLPVAAAAAQTAPPPAVVSATTFVFNGRGWGHGVGMSQYGALGYAKAGVLYDEILRHFYPGTEIGPAPIARIRVLLAEDAKAVTITSESPFRVRDGLGAPYELAPGRYALGPKLRLRLAPGAPLQPLLGPLTFVPGRTPLRLDRPYRGNLVVTATGSRLIVVNDVPLEAYIRGVVSDEMPRDWPLEAVKAQAVAARSYAVAQRRTGPFDVYADTRDQVYGGVEAETPVSTAAVAQTKREVLFFEGRVATTYFFSSSGGRTAAVQDVFGNKPVPYLVSVDDPHSALSPHHVWGPVTVSAADAAKRLAVPGLAELRPEPANSRARLVVASGRSGDVMLRGSDVRRALELRSAWFRVGVLSLSRPGGVVAPATPVALTGVARRLQGVTLEQRVGTGSWSGQPLSVGPDGSFSVTVSPAATTQYRLAAGEAKGGVLRVVVG